MPEMAALMTRYSTPGPISSPAFAGEGDQRSWWKGLLARFQNPSTTESSFDGPPPPEIRRRMKKEGPPIRGRAAPVIGPKPDWEESVPNPARLLLSRGW